MLMLDFLRFIIIIISLSLCVLRLVDDNDDDDGSRAVIRRVKDYF